MSERMAADARLSSIVAVLLDRDHAQDWSYRTGRVETLPGGIEVINRPQLLPPDDRFVRVQHMASTWQFLPLPDQWVEVRFFGHGEAGGHLDSPILRDFVRAAVAEAPLMTLRGLRRVVAAPRYQAASFPFVKDLP